jgi:dihydroflavonol-4-reductase
VKAAVTGGSGVVGQAVVRHLIASGHDVVAMTRSEGADSLITTMGGTPVRGDVLDQQSLDALVTGADCVFHVAGVNEMCSRHPDRMEQVNVLGSENVLSACQRAGVPRLVHTSSAAALGEEPGEVGTEGTEHRGSYHSNYERSKHLAERLLLSRSGDVGVVVVNPSSVQGPGRSTGTGKLVLDVLRGDLRYLVDTRISLVDIDDCAAGHLLAAEVGVPGQRYVLSGASLTIGEAVTLLQRVAGATIDVKFLPGWAAAIGGCLVEAAYRISGKQPPVCREMIRVMRSGAWYDGSLATRDLGLEYTPIEVTMTRTVGWFRNQGLLN